MRRVHAAVDARPSRLFVVLAAFFVTNALLAEFVGTKIFSLEGTLGLAQAAIPTFVDEPLSFNLTAGVVLWPFVFVLTDIVNEYFGTRGVRRLSFIAVGVIVYAFAMVFLSIELAPADFWATRTFADGRTLDMQFAYEAIFGQGLWIIAGSIVAFLVAQLVDVAVFHALKRRTGEGRIWLRATGSTLVSQLIDSIVVLWIAFGLNPDTRWSVSLIASVAFVNYLYKFAMALLMTPVIYGAHAAIERYLGPETAGEMRRSAMQG